MDKTTIMGNKGQIIYPTFDRSQVLLDTEQNGRQTFDFDLPRHIQQPLIQTVVDDLLGEGKCPSNGVSGARTNRVMEKLILC